MVAGFNSPSEQNQKIFDIIHQYPKYSEDLSKVRNKHSCRNIPYAVVRSNRDFLIDHFIDVEIFYLVFVPIYSIHIPMRHFSFSYIKAQDFLSKYGEFVNASYLSDESINQLKDATALILEEVKTLEAVLKCSEFDRYWEATENEKDLVDVIVNNEETGNAFISGKFYH